MKVFLTGATGVVGRRASTALRVAGHEVGGLARTPERAHQLAAVGVRPVVGSLFDSDALTKAFEGYDAVCNLATHIPVGMAAARPGAWRTNDRIRTEGSRRVAEAAKRAGVLRLVQESVSFLYGDGGAEWLDETSPLMVTRATEPVAQAETNASTFACAHRVSVVLRFGTIVCDDPLARWRMSRPATCPGGAWTHILHPDDVGPAVVAALSAPTGVFNVGAEPVLRAEVDDAFPALRTGRGGPLQRMLVRFGRERLEPLTRSHRISSDRFTSHTGWMPMRARFSAGWFSDELVAA